KQTFGRTEQEEGYFLTSRQGYYISPTGLTSTFADSPRRQFAEYMMRRLTEYHTDNVLKTEPQFRKIYEVKQAMSNLNVTIASQYRFELNYSFVGNYMKGTFTNPLALVL